jgi:putative ABC transport system ATP-binding protein
MGEKKVYFGKENSIMFINLKNAVKKYGAGETEVYALDHADLELEEGKICVILGPSGSGKSTLLNMLGGLDSLDSGELTVGGRKVSGLSVNQRTDYRKEDVGFVFQFYNLIPDLTVEENIQVVADISAKPLDMDEVLRALDIEKYRRRFPKELSGGQQQRVAIARAMIKNPKLLLCDELTGALDTKSSRSVLKFVEKMNAQFGTTVVIITHNEAIAGMADQVIRLKDGKIVESQKNAEKCPAAELVL